MAKEGRWTDIFCILTVSVVGGGMLYGAKGAIKTRTYLPAFSYVKKNKDFYFALSYLTRKAMHNT